ncbi:transposable element Tcb2 transposase [Trichonephila clavipes]|nr:transposable element Tcb2 transposase [Trichonephila clavipes]
MDDNARPHRTLAVEELLESEDITRMDWPAYSPDLNPIEHVWDALERRIAALLHHPENTQQLKQLLIEEWALLPQEMLHQLVLSMRRRCEATIANCPIRRIGTGQFFPILGRCHPLESFNCNNSLQSLDDVMHWSPSTVTILSNPWTMSSTGVLQL